MAWPLTPLTTYVSSTTPAIKAADLNSFQSGVNGIVAATYSLAGLYIDGTGGAPVTASPSHLVVKGTAPTIAPGNALGTGGTAQISVGSDTAGSIVCVTGTSPAAPPSTLFTVTLANTMPDANFQIFLFPASPAALSAGAYWNGNISATKWPVSCNTTLTASGTNYSWLYLVVCGA